MGADDSDDDVGKQADTMESQGARGVMPAWMPDELKDTAWGQGQ